MYLYLILNLSAVILPFIFSFHTRIHFDKEWKWFFPANILVAVFFVAWDRWFTLMGVWGFNPVYLMEVYLFDLPVEEILFFICIPFASIFTFHALYRLYPKFHLNNRFYQLLLLLLAGIFILLAIIYRDKFYTCSVFSLATISLVAGHFLIRQQMDHFFMMFLIILIPFFIINGILTGTGIPDEVVWYNNEENLGIRLLTIPIEDVGYGMALLLLNLILMESIRRFALRKHT
ncbi:MAG: lycopene cyclase domain-containing protein [Saprospiraceae bacterium]